MVRLFDLAQLHQFATACHETSRGRLCTLQTGLGLLPSSRDQGDVTRSPNLRPSEVQPCADCFG